MSGVRQSNIIIDSIVGIVVVVVIMVCYRLYVLSVNDKFTVFV
jgi:hypothetical protein